MDLGAFLADESIGGSWADEEVDMSSIQVPTSSTAAPVGGYYQQHEGSERREREEYPVPDVPPFKAQVRNLPYDATEDALARFLEDRLQARDIVEEVKLPMDMMTGRPKGFAFVTFSERAALEEALQLTMSDFNGRKIYVNVAAPQKGDVFDNDWRSLRTGPIGGGRRDRDREEVDLDWGAARSGGPLPPRERSSRPRRDEPDNLDWDSARSSGPLPTRERRSRFAEADLDWGSARQGSGPLPPRERAARPPRRTDEPDLDWGAARTGAPLPAKERPVRKEGEWNSARGGFKKKDEKEFDWKRGQALEPRKKAAAPAKKEEENKPQKSLYDVLALDSDSEEAVVQEVADLSVSK